MSTPADTMDYNNVSTQPNNNVVYINRIILLQRPTSLEDLLPFLIIFFVYSLVGYLLFYLWRTKHKKSHDIFILLLILFFPIIVMLGVRDIYFFILWIGFVVYLSHFVRLAHLLHNLKDAPRYIYTSFKLIFTIQTGSIFTLMVCVISSFFFYKRLLILFLRLLLYMIYLAILAREVINNLGVVMAKKAGYYTEGLPGRAESPSECMICTNSITDATNIMISCGHKYHVDCVVGFCLIANHKHCPFCKTPIQTDIFEKTLWLKSELMIKPIMDTMRSSISFIVVMLFIYTIKK